MNLAMIKKSTGWQRKATLLFKSEKLLGAEQIFAFFAERSVAEMKATLITPELQIFDTDLPLADESKLEPKRVKDLHQHFARLQQEFLHQPLLCLYHAVLVVLLRRNFNPQTLYPAFEQLWQTEFVFLSQNLSLRWLVSATDTFVDFSPNVTRQAILLNVATLVNTLKVYETQQDLLTIHRTPDPTKIEAHRQTHLALYEGLHYFRVGTDDTLKNMRSRYEKFATVDKFATEFLLMVFDRLQREPTAFALLKNLHSDEKSQWW